MHEILNWLYYFFGVSGSGSHYGFWSGAGSDIGEVAILGGIISIWKGTRCHIDKCNRHGKHPYGHYKLCGKHHPDVPDHITHLHIKSLHKHDTM